MGLMGTNDIHTAAMAAKKFTFILHCNFRYQLALIVMNYARKEQHLGSVLAPIKSRTGTY